MATGQQNLLCVAKPYKSFDEYRMIQFIYLRLLPKWTCERNLKDIHMPPLMSYERFK